MVHFFAKGVFKLLHEKKLTGELPKSSCMFISYGKMLHNSPASMQSTRLKQLSKTYFNRKPDDIQRMNFADIIVYFLANLLMDKKSMPFRHLLPKDSYKVTRQCLDF